MKKLYFVLLLSMFFGKTVAQNISVRYHNLYGNLVSNVDAASFFSEYHISDTGVLHNQFFIASNKICLSERLTDTASMVRNGRSVFFYPNGQISSTGSYVNNKKQGPWISFHPNGYLKDSAFYDNGFISNVFIRWHSNGAYADSISYDKDKFFMGSWFDNGNPSSFGYCKGSEDSLIGTWTFFHQNGQIAAKEEYDSLGKLITAKYFDENGKVVENVEQLSLREQTENAVKALDKYLRKNVSFPIGRIKKDVLVSLAVEFIIDEEGKVNDVFVLVPSKAEYNEAFIKALKTFDKWPSFSHKNRKIKQKIALPRHYFYWVKKPMKSGGEFDTNNGLYESRFDSRIESNRRFESSMRGQGINDKW